MSSEADQLRGLMLVDPKRALRVAGSLLVACAAILLLVWSTATAAKLLAFVGGVWCTWIARAAVVIILLRRRRWLHLSAFLAAIVMSEALIGNLKGLYE